MGQTFTEAQKVQIRRWMGASYIFNQMWPKLELAMTTIYAKSDGGTQADDSAVIMVQGFLTNLTTLEGQEVNLAAQMQVMAASYDTVKLDAAGKGLYGLRKIMKRYIGHIADVLSCHPLRDVFQDHPTQYEPGQEERAFSDYGV